MKKSILTLMSIVALFVTSCVQADVDGVQTVGDEAVVSLNVATAASSSRTIADGEKATKLQYAVYDENWNHIYTAEAVTLVDRKATLELSLLTGSTYNFAFWADADKGYYTPDFPNKKVSVSYTGAEANDESRDAFYGILQVEVKGTTQASVDLKRPFAQVNFGTSDLDRAEALGFDVNDYTTKFTVSTYETLNFVDGSVEDAVEVTFAAKAPQTETATLTAGGKNYTWIAMNYVLCPEANASLGVCTMEATDGTKNFKVEYPMAPARRNWKTNLVGTLFTDSTKVEVEVTPGTGGDNDTVVNMVPVTTAAELEAALTNPEVGGAVLKNDITLSTTISRAEAEAGATIAKSFVIDGGGKTLTYTGTERAIDIVSEVENETYKNVTIKDLTIKFTASCNRGINYNANGNLVLDNVKIGGEGQYVVYALNFPGKSDNAKVEINNCEVTGCIALNVWGENMEINVNNSILTSVDETDAENYSAVVLNNDGITMANGTVVNIKGGKVIALDEKGEQSYAVKNNSLTGEVNIDETTEVIGKIAKNVAIVYFDGYNEFYGCPSLAEAVETYFENANADGIRLIRDIELDASLTIPAGRPVVLDLNGKTISGTDNATGSFGLIYNTGELTVVGPGKLELSATNDRDWNAYSSVISNNPGGNLLVKGGVVIEHLGGTDMAYGIDNLTNGKGTVAVTTIEDATVKSTYRAVRQFLNGVEATNELYVKNGAVIEGVNKSIWMQDPSKNANTGKLVVEAGAQLKGNVYLTVTAGSTEWPVEVSIAKAALVDGSEVLTNNVPAQYEVVEEDGNYVVNELPLVTDAAELKAAIEAGGKYVLANDIAVTERLVMTNTPNFTLDGNGHTISQNFNNEYALFDDIKATTATFKNIVFDGLNGGAVMRSIGGSNTVVNVDNITVQNCNHTQVQGLLRLTGKSTIKNSTFKNNTCSMVISLNYDGANNDPQVVENCVFEKNTCSATAVVYYVKGAGATINGNKFVDNTVTVTSSSNAATLYMGFTENNVVTGNLFQNNTVNAGTSKRVAGGIMIGYAATITGNAFIGNTVNGENAKGNDVCASVYYTDIDLSGNYWGGSAPVENENYFVEYPDSHSVIINDYLTENPIK